MRPRLLDLFCGAGGCAKGYQRAGFEVIGVDIKDQPNYCGDDFFQGDALEYLEGLLEVTRDPEHDYSHVSWDWAVLGVFDAIHASPPCQGYTSANRKHPATRDRHPRLIECTRDLLEATDLPYVIENVPGARSELKQPVQVCGRTLGIGTHRHRLFETNWFLMTQPCSRPDDKDCAVYGKLDGRRLWTRADGSELRAPKTLEEAQEAMGIDWMGWDELKEAIPPVMTEFVGHQLLDYLRVREAA